MMPGFFGIGYGIARRLLESGCKLTVYALGKC
jgi:NAD(P)-dependent dehydrogenase (short-subunit alcohol dehydrogenase family)